MKRFALIALLALAACEPAATQEKPGHDHAHGDEDHAHGEAGHDHDEEGHDHDGEGHAGQDGSAGDDHGDEITLPQKRQQAIDFKIVPAETRTIRHSFDAYGTLRARTGGEGVVLATTAGRVSSEAMPMLGARVEKGQTLAWLLPALADQGDPASLGLAVSQASLKLRAARVERERLEGLVRDGVVAQRRLIEAQLAEQQAQAELSAARQRSGQARGASSNSGKRPRGSIELKAPMSGVVVTIDVPPGLFVESGQELFRIVDPDPIWLEVKVPEVHVPLLSGEKLGLWFEVDGLEQTFDVAPDAMSLGGAVNPVSRTLPVIAAVPNPEGTLRPGMFADVHVVESIHEDVAVPTGALVIEDGMPVVYVALGPDTFERRIVEIGPRDRGWLAIERGLKAGEKVVSKGSYAVRLAALGDQSKAGDGHSH